MIRQEIVRQKQSVQALIDGDVRFKKRLERSVPILLLFAIGAMIAWKADVITWFWTALHVSVFLGCAIHTVILLRSCEARMKRSEEHLQQAKACLEEFDRTGFRYEDTTSNN